LLTLEDRTVLNVGPPVPGNVVLLPINSTPDNVGTFVSFDAALAKLGYFGGTMTIEPGAVVPSTPRTISTVGIILQGDPKVSSSILPPLNLTLDCPNVTLNNLNLASVTLDPQMVDLEYITITHCTVGNITLVGGTPAANPYPRTISQNYITGEVTLGPASGPIADRVTYNTFAGSGQTMLLLNQDNNAVVEGNTFLGGAIGAPQTAISIESSQNVMIVNNTIRLPGASVSSGAGTDIGIAISPSTTSSGTPPVVTYGPVSTGSILNNVLSTANPGIGLSITSVSNETTTADADTKFLVQGNAFNGDGIGVNYVGSGGATIGTDLGAGALQSLGSNDFRGFDSSATATAGAIVASNLGTGVVLKAQSNIFNSGVTPANVVFTTQPTAGTATIDVSASLTGNQAFVQTLYNNLLGRSGQMSELNYWVQVLTGNGPNSGRSAAVSGINSSIAALNVLVDSYYLKFLGRVADTAGAQYWVTMIQNGMALESVQAAFVSSPEFISTNNTDYVQALYRAFFNRTGSTSDLNYWYGQLQQTNGLNLVARGFANSQENKGVFADDCFTDYLHRQASSTDRAYWETQGSLFNIRLGILSSDEYFQVE